MLPIICHNHRYRLITGKDRTRLFTFSAIQPHESCTVNRHIGVEDCKYGVTDMPLPSRRRQLTVGGREGAYRIAINGDTFFYLRKYDYDVNLVFSRYFNECVGLRICHLSNNDIFNCIKTYQRLDLPG